VNAKPETFARALDRSPAGSLPTFGRACPAGTSPATGIACTPCTREGTARPREAAWAAHGRSSASSMFVDGKRYASRASDARPTTNHDEDSDAPLESSSSGWPYYTRQGLYQEETAAGRAFAATSRRASWTSTRGLLAFGRATIAEPRTRPVALQFSAREILMIFPPGGPQLRRIARERQRTCCLVIGIFRGHRRGERYLVGRVQNGDVSRIFFSAPRSASRRSRRPDA